MDINQLGNTLTNGFWSGTPALKGADKEVWIAVRTDGVDGVGTVEDPFDGSGSKFDPLMAGLPAHITIHLMAGTYLTEGTPVKDGWKVFGAGIGSTVIQLSSAGASYLSIVLFTAGGGSASNVEIRDLTLDANYPAFAATLPAGYTLWSLVFDGSDNKVVNCESINTYGIGTGAESFSFLLERGDNLVIEGCYAHLFYGGYTNGPCLAYGTNGVIRNCRTEGAGHGFGNSGMKGLSITGCSCGVDSNHPLYSGGLPTGRGYYTDTDSTEELILSGNTFYVSEIPVQFNNFAGGICNDVVIADNYFDSVTSLSSGNCAIALGCNGRDFRICDNVYVYRGTLNNTGFLLKLGDIHGVTVEGNHASSRVITISVSATGGTFTITVSGQTTPPLPYNVSAATMQTALEALTTVGQASVDGGPGNAGGNAPYYVAIVTPTPIPSPSGSPNLTTNATSLTGGAGTATVSIGSLLGFGALGWGAYPANVWPDAKDWYLGTNCYNGVPGFGNNAQRQVGTSDGWYRIIAVGLNFIGSTFVLRIEAHCGTPEPGPPGPVFHSAFTLVASVSRDGNPLLPPSVLSSTGNGAIDQVRCGIGTEYVIDVHFTSSDPSILVDGTLYDRNWVQFVYNPSLSGFIFSDIAPIPLFGSYIPHLYQSNSGRGLANEIWISVRTDGNAGTGTADDPFDGSTELKFDALLQSLPANTTIHLLPGLFLTGGGGRTDGHGFGVKSGWKILGAGTGNTIVKLNSIQTGLLVHGVFVTTGSASDHVDIRDLTLDGNSGVLIGTGLENHRIDGINLTGKNCATRRCESINSYAIEASGRCFSFVITGDCGKIEDCYGHAFHGGFTAGAAIKSGRDASIRNCRLEGVGFPYMFSDVDGGMLTECVADVDVANGNAANYAGYFSDLGYNYNVVISNNIFRASVIPIAFLQTASDIVVSDNYLESSNTGTGSACAIGLGGDGINARICNNTYKYTGSVSGNGLILNLGTMTGVTVEGNQANVGPIGWGGSDWRQAAGWYLGNNVFANLPDLPLNAQIHSGTASGWYRLLTAPAAGAGLSFVLRIWAYSSSVGKHTTMTIIVGIPGYGHPIQPSIISAYSGGAAMIDRIRVASGGPSCVLDLRFTDVNPVIMVEGFPSDRNLAQFTPGPTTSGFDFCADLTVPDSGSFIPLLSTDTLSVSGGIAGGLPGTATNDNAAAGKVGEFVTATLASAGAVAITPSATTKNIITSGISLTAGDWDLSGTVNFLLAAATVSKFQAGISLTSATLPSQAGGSGLGTDPLVIDVDKTTTLTDTKTLGIPPVRLSIAATTTVYLVAQATFTAGTVKGFGTIRARRMR
jgi:hypothetical protein